jgi:alkanesulfonate monooxygenase
MSIEFFWRLPLGGDGPYLALDKNMRGAQAHRPGYIAAGRLPGGQDDGFTYIDYVARVTACPPGTDIVPVVANTARVA